MRIQKKKKMSVIVSHDYKISVAMIIVLFIVSFHIKLLFVTRARVAMLIIWATSLPVAPPDCMNDWIKRSKYYDKNHFLMTTNLPIIIIIHHRYTLHPWSSAPVGVCKCIITHIIVGKIARVCMHDAIAFLCSIFFLPLHHFVFTRK